MKIFNIVLIIIAFVMLNISCKKDNAFDGDERGGFLWARNLENHKAVWKVHCDSICSSCIAKDTVYKDTCVYDSLTGANICHTEPVYYNVLVDRNIYKDVYSYCSGLPYEGGVIDTTVYRVIPTGKITFQPDLGAHYWFDDWRSNENRQLSKTNYVSVPKDSNTAFCIYVGDGVLNAFDSAVVSIPANATNKLSFDKAGTISSVKLSSGYNSLHVYPLIGAVNGDTIEVFVHGYYDKSDIICLAGDCLESEDRLKVIMFPTDIPKGQVATITNYYDENGRLTRSIKKISDDHVIYDLRFTYDKKGNRLTSDVTGRRP